MFVLANLSKYICKVLNRENFEYGYYDNEEYPDDEPYPDDGDEPLDWHYDVEYSSTNTLIYQINDLNVGFTKYFSKDETGKIKINIYYACTYSNYIYTVSNLLNHVGDSEIYIDKQEQVYGYIENIPACKIRCRSGNKFTLSIQCYESNIANILLK